MTGEASGQQESEAEAVALDVWLQFLRCASGDDDSAFEKLCSERTDIALQLRKLRSEESKIGLAETTDSSFRERLRGLAKPLLRGARFRREGEIARGGMGVIHKVRDLELERSLALKEMIVGPAERHPVAASRFLEEAQVTAQLDHPGIVPIHEVGMDAEGRIYFAMKLVRGRDLRTILNLLRERREGWSQTRALGVLLKVCEAMAYAHSKGVIHRDLKPGNVMVGSFGEVYVMDWGLARAAGRHDIHDVRIKLDHGSISVQTARRSEREETPDSPLVTMDGDVVGTPSYMSPEQGRGDVQAISPRSDVYSVGAMLYHLLTGQAPFVSPGGRVSSRAVLARLLDGPPTAVQALNPKAPDELVAICDKSMARDAESRYTDTSALAVDLLAYLEGHVVAAYEAGAWAEAKKWLRRNQALAIALGIILVLLYAATTYVAINRLALVRKQAALIASLSALKTVIAGDDLSALSEAERMSVALAFLEAAPLPGKYRLDYHDLPANSDTSLVLCHAIQDKEGTGFYLVAVKGESAYNLFWMADREVTHSEWNLWTLETFSIDGTADTAKTPPDPRRDVPVPTDD